LQLVPPLVLTSHCTVGVGLPLAAAVNDTLAPAVTVWLAGWVVMIGAVVVTVGMAAVVVAVPAVLVEMASDLEKVVVVGGGGGCCGRGWRRGCGWCGRWCCPPLVPRGSGGRGRPP